MNKIILIGIILLLIGNVNAQTTELSAKNVSLVMYADLKAESVAEKAVEVQADKDLITFMFRYSGE